MAVDAEQDPGRQLGQPSVIGAMVSVQQRPDRLGRRAALAIVKHIAGAHGGRARAHSMPGQGSTFEIYLPARRRHSRDAETVP